MSQTYRVSDNEDLISRFPKIPQIGASIFDNKTSLSVRSDGYSVPLKTPTWK